MSFPGPPWTLHLGLPDPGSDNPLRIRDTTDSRPPSGTVPQEKTSYRGPPPDWDQHSGRIGGISTSAHFYYKLSQEFNEDMEQVVESFVSVQRQINSLASVALKNRRALDLLTTKKGGTCLFLEEDCCYFVNETGLFQERVREFRDRIKRCKKEL